MSDDRPKLSRSTRQLLDDWSRNTPGRIEDSARPLPSQVSSNASAPSGTSGAGYIGRRSRSGGSAEPSLKPGP